MQYICEKGHEFDECHTLGIETLSEAELRGLYEQADTLYRNTEKR